MSGTPHQTHDDAQAELDHFCVDSAKDGNRCHHDRLHWYINQQRAKDTALSAKSRDCDAWKREAEAARDLITPLKSDPKLVAYAYIPGASKNEYTEAYLAARAATDALTKEPANGA